MYLKQDVPDTDVGDIVGGKWINYVLPNGRTSGGLQVPVRSKVGSKTWTISEVYPIFVSLKYTYGKQYQLSRTTHLWFRSTDTINR